MTQSVGKETLDYSSYGPRIFGFQMTDFHERINMERMRKGRLERAQKLMKEANISAMLLLLSENMRYTTGYVWLQYVPSGGYVFLPVEGDPILLLDKEFATLEYEQLQYEFQLQQNKKSQLLLQIERNEIDLQAQYDIKEYEIQLLESRSVQKSRLYNMGGISKDEYEQDNFNLNVAKRELQRIASQLTNQKASFETDLKELDLQLEIQKKQLTELERQLELANVKAENDGIVTWVNDNIGATIHAGTELAHVADLSSYKIMGSISDIHAEKLKINGNIIIRIYQTDLRGKITNINPVILMNIDISHK